MARQSHFNSVQLRHSVRGLTLPE